MNIFTTSGIYSIIILGLKYFLFAHFLQYSLTYIEQVINLRNVKSYWELRIWKLGQIFKIELWMVGQ